MTLPFKTTHAVLWGCRSYTPRPIAHHHAHTSRTDSVRIPSPPRYVPVLNPTSTVTDDPHDASRPHAPVRERRADGCTRRHSPTTTMSMMSTTSMRTTTTAATGTTDTHRRRVVVPGARRASVVRGRRRAMTTTRAAAAKPWGERDCRLVLEDGSVWPGRAFGAKKTMVGEVVFNTSLSGCARIARERTNGGGRIDRWGSIGRGF